MARKGLRWNFLAEKIVAQQPRYLGWRIRMTVTERRMIHPCPDTPPVRHHDQDASAFGHDPPYLAQQLSKLFRTFQCMHHQYPVHRYVWQGQIIFQREADDIAPFRRPADNALLRRHQRDDALRFFQERPEEGIG